MTIVPKSRVNYKISVKIEFRIFFVFLESKMAAETVVTERAIAVCFRCAPITIMSVQ